MAVVVVVVVCNRPVRPGTKNTDEECGGGGGELIWPWNNKI